jgi:putative ABC transport system permease protein
LIGLITFNTEIKTKEIAIRKAHGAKVGEITLLLNANMIKWFAIAFAISCALSYAVMNKWLSNFTFRIDLSWWIFALGAMIILVITLFTISCQTWKAATQKPIDALKHE